MQQETLPLVFGNETSWGTIRTEGWNKRIFVPSKKKGKNGKPEMMPIQHHYVLIFYSNKKGDVIRERRFWLTFRKNKKTDKKELSGISDSDRASDGKFKPHAALTSGHIAPTVRSMGQELTRLLGNPDIAESIMAHVLDIDAKQEPKEEA